MRDDLSAARNRHRPTRPFDAPDEFEAAVPLGCSFLSVQPLTTTLFPLTTTVFRLTALSRSPTPSL